MGHFMPSSVTPAISTQELVRRLVTPAQALYAPEFLGLRPPAKPDQAAALQIARHRFPIPTVLVMGRRMVLVADIHDFIDGLRPPTAPEPRNPALRKRGRPRKADLAIRAGAAAQGVGND